MIITYLGAQFVRVQFGDIVIAFDPISKTSKLNSSRFGADICITSINNPDMNGFDQVTHGDKKPFIIDGPGEYEVKDVVIKGFLSSSDYGGKKSINTVYKVILEGINLCFLGALNEDNLSKEAEETFDDIDILFVPIGGNGVLDPARAYKLAVNMEPKVIIPMHYGDITDNKECLKMFIKESGNNANKGIDKLTIKRKDLEGKEAELVILDPTNS